MASRTLQSLWHERQRDFVERDKKTGVPSRKKLLFYPLKWDCGTDDSAVSFPASLLSPFHFCLLTPT